MAFLEWGCAPLKRDGSDEMATAVKMKSPESIDGSVSYEPMGDNAMLSWFDAEDSAVNTACEVLGAELRTVGDIRSLVRALRLSEARMAVWRDATFSTDIDAIGKIIESALFLACVAKGTNASVTEYTSMAAPLVFRCMDLDPVGQELGLRLAAHLIEEANFQCATEIAAFLETVVPTEDPAVDDALVRALTAFTARIGREQHLNDAFEVSSERRLIPPPLIPPPEDPPSLPPDLETCLHRGSLRYRALIAIE